MPRGPLAFVLGLLLVLGLSSPASRASVAQDAEPLPLGTLSLTSATDPTCPSGFGCLGMEVECPGVAQKAPGFVAIAPPTGAHRGVVVMFSGGGGYTWWGATSSLTPGFLTDLRADGFTIVQVRWVHGWHAATPGEDAGSAHLACRPATLVTWAHDELYSPLGLSPLPGQCGFCLTGNSAGASQASYALSHYGLDGIVGALIPTSGPPHAAQVKGCVPTDEQRPYRYRKYSRLIDASYGYPGRGGPCMSHDPSWIPRWEDESVDTGARDLLYPSTRVHFIIGGLDAGASPYHASDYRDALVEAQGTLSVSYQVVPSSGHDIFNDPEAVAALRAALLA